LACLVASGARRVLAHQGGWAALSSTIENGVISIKTQLCDFR
jgi:hypothetical protein